MSQSLGFDELRLQYLIRITKILINERSILKQRLKQVGVLIYENNKEIDSILKKINDTPPP